MKYANGVFERNLIPNENVLSITLSKDEGQSLESAIPLILDQYKREITTIQFKNIEPNQAELAHLCKSLHSSNIKTAVEIPFNDASSINKRLFNELDYVSLSSGKKLLKKDYCPFADAYDWIDITKT